LEQGLEILSNLAEIDLENPKYLRILLFKLDEFGYHLRAENLQKKLYKIRPEEPQTLLNLATALMAHANCLFRDLVGGLMENSTEKLAKSTFILEVGKYFEEAVALLVEVILGKWDVRDYFEHY